MCQPTSFSSSMKRMQGFIIYLHNMIILVLFMGCFGASDHQAACYLSSSFFAISTSMKILSYCVLVLPQCMCAWCRNWLCRWIRDHRAHHWRGPVLRPHPLSQYRAAPLSKESSFAEIRRFVIRCTRPFGEYCKSIIIISRNATREMKYILFCRPKQTSFDFFLALPDNRYKISFFYITELLIRKIWNLL